LRKIHEKGGHFSTPTEGQFCTPVDKDVQNPKDSLGAPDGRYAEILPGGQLVVFMEKKIYPFPFIGGNPEAPGLLDSGSVVGKGGADFSLEGWLPMQDTEDKQRCAWTPLGLSVSGFCLLPTYCMGMDMIRITNLGTKSLFVDAVIGYGKDGFDDRLAFGAKQDHDEFDLFAHG
jgi:hypothetical protein